MQNKITFSATDYMSKSWDIFKSNWKALTAVFLVSALITAPISVMQYLIEMPYQVYNPETYMSEVVGMPLPWTLINFSLSILAIIISVILSYNGAKIYFSVLENRTFSYKNLFDNIDANFWKCVATTIALIIAVILGLIAFIIPGMYIALRYGFAPYVALRDGLSVGESFHMSSKMTDGYLWSVLWFHIVIMVLLIFIVLIGVFCLFFVLIPAGLTNSLLTVLITALFLALAVLPVILVVSILASLSQIMLYKALYDNANKAVETG
jgi:hypothetical protein